jgi:hypothetical protein
MFRWRKGLDIGGHPVESRWVGDFPLRAHPSRSVSLDICLELRQIGDVPAAVCSRRNVTLPGVLDRQQIPRLEEDD